VTAQLRFLREIKQKVELFPLHRSHLSRCHELMKKYADLPIDLADASLVMPPRNWVKGLYSPPISVTSMPTAGKTSIRSKTCCCPETDGGRGHHASPPQTLSRSATVSTDLPG
jgi:hypothetical protein